MELFRKEMDKSILNGIKDKISRYLQSKNLNADFFRANMDAVAGLYVENSIERGNSARMECRWARNGRPPGIYDR